MGFSLGTCVETTLGTGIVVEFRREDEVHVVRLWKPRGMYSKECGIIHQLSAKTCS